VSSLLPLAGGPHYTRPMIRGPHRPGFRRSVALFVLAVFMGSGTTLPSADALLYHWGISTERQGSHVEPAGGCGSHTDACTLGRAATGSGAVLTGAGFIRAAGTASKSAEPVLESSPRTAAPRTHPPSRAPPVTVC
jgi:hypothetical protein